MKNYENFDHTFFAKIICVIAAITLLFAIAAVLIGIITGDSSSSSEDDNAETFIFNDSESEPPITYTDTSKPLAPMESDTEEISKNTETEKANDTFPSTDTSEFISTESEPPVSEPQPTQLEETEDFGEEYINSIIFLGDSTTYGLKAYKMLKDGKNTDQVWTSDSATLSLNEILTKKIIYPENGKEILIADAAEQKKPEYLIITLGVEGVTFLEEDDFREQYTSLVEAVKKASPNTKIMLQSIFPVSSDLKKLNNSLITKANGWILEIAETTGVRYLDTQSVLKDENGDLNPKFDNGGNGINLNDAGFTAVLNYIRTHGYK